ncbi:MAG: hypothetical protein ACK5TR_00235 [Alphaproteobacteria bacterium]
MVANSWSYYNNVGNIVLYPPDTKPKKIGFSYPGNFNDASSKSVRYRSSLKYKYIEEMPDGTPLMIIEKVDTPEDYQSRGYGGFCVAYFMNDFLLKRTLCKTVAADCRGAYMQNIVRKHGFHHQAVAGLQEPMRVSFVWQAP